MVEFENLPKQEEMKSRFKKPMYCMFPDDINYFKEKKHRRRYDWNWYLDNGRKPHSHKWGRKPAWRMKRREQRRNKHERYLSNTGDLPRL